MAQKHEAIINYGLQQKKSKQEIIAALIKENELNNAGGYLKQLDEYKVFGDGGETQKSQDAQAKTNLGSGDLLKQYYTNRSILDSLDKYKTLYSEATKDNTILPTEVEGTNAAKLKSMYNDIIFQVAQAEGTGALQAADREVVESMLPNVSTPNPFTTAGQMIRGGREGNIAAFDTVLDSAKERVARLSGSPEPTQKEDQAQVAEKLNKAVEFAKANPDDPQSKRFMEDWDNNRIDLNTGKLKDEFRELTPYGQKLKEQTTPAENTVEQPKNPQMDRGIFGRFWDSVVKEVPELTGELGDRVKNIFNNTIGNYKESKDRSVFENVVRGQETLLRNLGEVGGAVGDVAGSALSLAYGTAVSNDVKEEIKKTASDFMNTEGGKTAMQALQGGVEAWEGFKKENPNLAKDLEASFNIVTALPLGKGMVIAAKEAKAVAGDVAELGVRTIGKDATQNASSQIFRAVKPSLTVARDKKSIRKVLDVANSELVDRGFSPKNLREYSENLSETRKNVWGEVEKAIGKSDGLQVDAKSIADEIRSMAASPEILRADPGVAKRLEVMADNLISQGEKMSVPDAEALKQFLNSDLKGAFGKFNLSNAEQNAMKLTTKRIGEQLDNLLSEIPGDFQSLKNKYGALRQVEDDVMKRLIVFERQNPQGLVESFSKISGIGNMIKAFLPMGGGVATFAKGVAELGMGQIQKRANDADLIIKKAFEKMKARSGDFTPKSETGKALQSMKGKAGLSIEDVSTPAQKRAAALSKKKAEKDAVDIAEAEKMFAKGPNAKYEAGKKRAFELAKETRYFEDFLKKFKKPNVKIMKQIFLDAKNSMRK